MEDLRQTLKLYAYNILGSYEEAKDVVQDVYLKFLALDQSKIQDEKSYLIRMVVNLAIDRKRKQQNQLASYPGPWLPEPVATDDPHHAVHRREILSYSLLVLLEKLSSKQRAVFILKEAFDYDHEEISRVLDISVENSRKILSRAKTELRETSNRVPAEGQRNELKNYIKVIESGDISALEALLSNDVSATSDGGGKATALRNIIYGVRKVGALLSGLYRKKYQHTIRKIAWINHEPAILYFQNQELVTCQIMHFREGKLDQVFFMRNPEKLAGLRRNYPECVTF